MKQSQEAWILSRLSKTGSISRNECLKMYISRLGAHIGNLKLKGYKFEGKYVKTKNGRNYKYTLIK